MVSLRCVLFAAFLLLPAAGAGATIIVEGTQGTAGAAGGQGQPGGEGGEGEAANASGDDTDVRAHGGFGGPGGDGGAGLAAGENGGNGGHGGAGGSATAVALSPVVNARAESLAAAGPGGNGGRAGSAGPGSAPGIGGNGGAGGDATAGATAIGSIYPAGIDAIAWGGPGGDAFDGGRAGDGGVARLGDLIAEYGAAINGKATGGDGGNGFGASDAGDGADTSLANPTAGAGLFLDARGGAGGDAEEGAAGDGGSATSDTGPSMSGSQGAHAWGGHGGDKGGGSGRAGDGGAATADARLLLSAFQLGAMAIAGDGGDGANGAGGGHGGDAAATAIGSSAIQCCAANAGATAHGGSGGDAAGDTADPGRGGSATASAAFESAFEDSSNFEPVQVGAYSVGGAAGDAPGASPTPADGGDASARAAVQNRADPGAPLYRIPDVFSYAVAMGGNAPRGIGGDAFATASAANDAESFADATAEGGFGSQPGGSATARAEVESPILENATALGRATARATSSGFDPHFAFQTTLEMQVGALIEGAGAVEARTVARLAAPDQDLADGLKGAAFGAALPVQADVEAALAARPEVAAAVAGLQTAALGFVQLSGAGYDIPFPPLPNAPQAEVSLEILLSDSVSLPESALVLGLLGSSLTGEFDELRFRVERQVGANPFEGIVEIVDTVFSDEAAWLAYFDDQALDLGPLEASAGETLRLNVFLEMLGDDNSAAVTADFIVGVAVPEPSTGLLVACGLGLLAVRAARARPW